MYQILVLEDHLNLAKIIKKVLLKEQYRVDVANNLIFARQLIKKYDYDLLIFDRLISGEDSLELLEELKFSNYFLKTLLISCKKMISDRLLSLRIADDFLAKPLSMPELLLRAKNLLKRSKTVLNQHYSCSDFVLSDAGQVFLYKTQKQLHLPDKEAQILTCLLIHKNQPVSYQTIFNYVWPNTDDYPQQRTLNVYVRRIRLKSPIIGQKIETLRNFGFILNSKSGEF